MRIDLKQRETWAENAHAIAQALRKADGWGSLGDQIRMLEHAAAILKGAESGPLGRIAPTTATTQPHQEGLEEGEPLVDGWSDGETCECGRGAHECATADDPDAEHGDRR